MKKILFVIMVMVGLLCVSSLSALADDEFTPMADILEDVRNSGRFDFHMTYFDKDAETKKVLSLYKNSPPDMRVTEKDGKTLVTRYSVPPEVTALITDSRKTMTAGDLKKAGDLLDSAKKLAPDYSKLYMLRGAIYILAGDQENFMKEMDRAINLNQGDFDAYAIRGDYFREKGEHEKALNDYILSVIYDRNNERAWKGLEKLGTEMGFSLYRAPFVPLYSFTELNTGKLRIYFDMDERVRWMPYSFTRAVWRYTPGYFEKKTGLKEYTETLQEEMEAVNSMTWAYKAFRERGNYQEDPLLERYTKIQERFFLRELVLFEIIGPRNPEMLAGMDKKYRQDMIDFIREFITVRNK